MDANYYIDVNGRKLWLDDESIAMNTAEGFDGDDEQCDSCGQPLGETNYSAADGYGHRFVHCKCGVKYMVKHYDGSILV